MSALATPSLGRAANDAHRHAGRGVVGEVALAEPLAGAAAGAPSVADDQELALDLDRHRDVPFLAGPPTLGFPPPRKPWA